MIVIVTMQAVEIRLKTSSPDYNSMDASPPPPPIHHQQLPHQQHLALAPAALWYSPKAAKRFIAQLQSSSTATGPLALASGESVSVKVPTNSQASAIFWEFATEQGDIGFGLTFHRDEAGGLHSVHKEDQLLPVTLKDCSEDLVLGNHQYQDEGVYTLEFVNSHSSLPRVVHYRVFYQNKVT